MTRLSFPVAALGMLLFVGAGCSGKASDPVTPGDEPILTEPGTGEASRRALWGIWDISIDRETGEVAIEPNRSLNKHFNVRGFLIPPDCSDCLTISLNSFDPATDRVDVDVTLKNPFQIDGYDVRGIVYTDDDGHELVNEDGWTELWDIGPGYDENPFKAYAKAEPNRIFEGGAAHTENYVVYMPTWNPVSFAVDASWPGNCEEPYDVTSVSQETLYDIKGSTAMLYVDILDWQDDVASAALYSEDLGGWFNLGHVSGSTWTTMIGNPNEAAAGEYEAMIYAWSKKPGNPYYEFIPITVSEWDLLDPVDITPDGLNMYPYDICTAGDYAYVAGGKGGLNVIDISAPETPVWVHRVPTTDARDVEVQGGLAYVADYNGGLKIIDVMSPESAYVVQSVDAPLPALSVDVESGYAYVAQEEAYIGIIDVDPVEEAHPVLMWGPYGNVDYDDIEVSGGYAFVSHSDYFEVYDVDPMEEMSEVAWIDLGTNVADIELSDGYAYVTDGSDGLNIISITDPESPAVVSTVAIEGPVGLCVSEGYAYVTDWQDALNIVDVDPVESAHIVNRIDIPLGNGSWEVGVAGGYAYVVDDTGVWAVRTEPPELAQIVGRSQSVGFSANVSLSEGYICSARGPIGGMQIVDVDPVTSAKVVGSIDPADSSGGGWYNNDVSASGGYAYVAGASFDVIDIDPAGSAQIVATMELPNPGVCVEYSGGYAYVIRSGIFYTLGRLMIMDVSSPLTPVIAGQVGVSGANDIAVVGEYGYIASGETGLKILDLEPPESVHKVQEVATQDYAGGVAVDGGYAYVADGKGDLKIIDVDPVESAYIVKTVPITGEARGVAVSGGYAYVAATAGSESGIHIVDIDPPESAWVCTYFDTPGSAEDVLVSGEYAYVADGLGGLRIIRLW